MPDRYRRTNERINYRRDYYRESSMYDRMSQEFNNSIDEHYETRSDRTYRRQYPKRSYSDYRPASRTPRQGYDYYRASARSVRTVEPYTPTEEKRGIGIKIIVVFILLAFVIGNFVLFSVLNDNNKKEKTENSETLINSVINKNDTIISTEDISKTHAKVLLSQMTTEEKIGQLFMIRSYGRDTQAFSDLIKQCKVGGIVLFKSDFENKTKQEVKDMISALQNAGGGKLFVCVDEEGGTVVRMSSLSELRSEKYKSPQELYKLGGYDEIKSDTINKCQFLKMYGVNVNFGPVADVVTEKSAFMYKRAFGKNADATGEYVKTVVSAMKENKIGSSIKHFPGYGNSKGDTHEGLDHNTLSIGSLKASDLVPFKMGVDAGADSIMVTHTIIDEIDANNPASLSSDCISFIREYLKFDGVVITDALDMGAIIEFCKGEDPCIQAINSGVDILCLPSDPVKSYENILNAVNEGKITQQRIDESVLRILAWKINLGMYVD